MPGGPNCIKRRPLASVKELKASTPPFLFLKYQWQNDKREIK